MIYFSLGLPGRFTEWCDAAIAHLAGRDGRSVASVTFPTLAEQFEYRGISPVLDEAALCLIRTNAAHLVMGARQPDEGLRAVLAQANVPFVLALDDPRAAIADIFTETSRDLRAVTRAVANSCPLLMRFSALPGALTIRGEEAAGNSVPTLLAIARHLKIAVTEDEARRIVEELAASGFVGSQTTAADWSSHIPAEGQKMVDGALAAYAAYFAGGGMGDIIWTRDLFLVAADPGRNPVGPIDVRDVQGTDRFLIYGPYMHVPPGYWSARVVMGVSSEAAGQTFTVDAYSGRQLASTKFCPRAGGIFTAEINFAVDELTGQGLEIRVLIGRERAPGQLAFGHVILRPIAVHHPETIVGPEADFKAAFDL